MPLLRPLNPVYKGAEHLCRKSIHNQVYNVETGKTIQILQDRVPLVLYRALPDAILDHHVELVIFPNSLNFPRIEGLTIYKFIFKTARLLLSSTYGSSAKRPIDIIHQLHSSMENKNVRYSMKCNWIASPNDEYTWVFHFDIDKKGIIYRHIIDNLERNRSRQCEKISALKPDPIE
ncbi:hypothetical protein POMI540_4550 [Schizosaccharomyces pombe]